MPVRRSALILSLPLPILLVLVALGTAAAIYDCRFRRIPNWLNLSGVVLGLGLNTYFLHLHGTARAMEGMLVAVTVYLPFYLLRGMGAGDVKLMAAIGCMVGPGNWFVIFIATSLVGGIAGAAVLVAKRRSADTCCNLYFLLKDLVHLRAPYKSNPALDFRNKASLRLPHGLVIAIGCAAALLWSSNLPVSRLGSF